MVRTRAAPNQAGGTLATNSECTPRHCSRASADFITPDSLYLLMARVPTALGAPNQAGAAPTTTTDSECTLRHCRWDKVGIIPPDTIHLPTALGRGRRQGRSPSTRPESAAIAHAAVPPHRSCCEAAHSSWAHVGIIPGLAAEVLCADNRGVCSQSSHFDNRRVCNQSPYFDNRRVCSQSPYFDNRRVCRHGRSPSTRPAAIVSTRAL